MTRNRDRAGTAGFTLLEVLVAISLLGLIFAALTGGLRFGVEAWRAGSERLADSDDMQLVHRLLRRQIGAALAPRAAAETGETGATGGLDEGTSPAFEGAADRLTFLAPAPTAGLPPGLYRVTFALRPDGAARALVFTWRPEGSGESGEEPVLRDVRALRIRYFGDPDGSGSRRWLSEWTGADAGLPLAVRVRFEFAAGSRAAWPEMSFAVPGRRG